MMKFIILIMEVTSQLLYENACVCVRPFSIHNTYYGTTNISIYLLSVDGDDHDGGTTRT